MKNDDAARDAAEYDECEHGVPGGNDCVDCMKRAHADEVRALNEEAEALATERDEARKMLAECYVLSGADPDGDDWRHLWQTAVAEVRQTMGEHRAEVKALAILDTVNLDSPPPCPCCGSVLHDPSADYEDGPFYRYECRSCGWERGGDDETPMTLATAPWTKGLAEVIRRAREVARG